jgi:transposase
MSAKKAPSLDAINYKIDEIIQLAKNVESNARDWAERFKALVEALAEAKKRRRRPRKSSTPRHQRRRVFSMGRSENSCRVSQLT